MASTTRTRRLLLLVIGTVCLATPSLHAKGEKLRVMTFNLRYANPNDPVVWEDRRVMQVDLIEEYSPDIIGTQEGLKVQVD